MGRCRNVRTWQIKNVTAVAFLSKVLIWHVSRSGIRVDLGFSLRCRWSSIDLLPPQLAAHMAVVLAGSSTLVVGALAREWCAGRKHPSEIMKT